MIARLQRVWTTQRPDPMEQASLPGTASNIATVRSSLKLVSGRFALILQAFSGLLTSLSSSSDTGHCDGDARTVGNAKTVWYSAHGMDYLWTPWRYSYLTAGEAAACIFCELLRSGDDRKSLIVHRGEHNLHTLKAFACPLGL